MSENQSTVDRPDVDIASVPPVEAEFTWKCGSPAYEIKGRLSVSEQLGEVVIKWELPLPYAFSKMPTEDEGVAVTLFGNDTVTETLRTVQRNGEWKTGKPWGSGWSANLANWDYAKKTWQAHLVTPKTKEA